MFKKSCLDTFWVSFVFYIFSNFFVFIFFDLYPKNISGLIQCYFYALPFFFNRLSVYAFLLSFTLRKIVNRAENVVL
jgi:hypothetical protein